jgi:hypothetical protein
MQMKPSRIWLLKDTEIHLVLLADMKDQVITGALEPEIHIAGEAKHVVLDFIAGELPAWRDRADRPSVKAEDKLTEQLCDHLNSSARHAAGIDRFRFHTEAADQTSPSRSIDLAIKPHGSVLIVDGRRNTIFDTILPIECKRLPTPQGSDRDPREYVYSAKKSTGGIQRFKEGNHAALHRLAGMIGEPPAGPWAICRDWSSTMALRRWLG